ncbi:hypothetical protein AO385_1255 [Moraxella catarrhalis]|uniref:Uncharacterized protein n=1 Tax=Moraxella catarrhalis TaxID=480 RepID=A0A198UX82_MORCA|nr:hypothetical protein AO383_1182 [Moraxella catarrhalis]OAU98440.1 hypothetical protein AO384_0024 [Moraxella catarrhalis]OAV00186.1 hypothetical protein AO385_1255 [Moraxella catarrhalis]OAV00927.1 hypothetical protein AO382_1045 [Moraxella catarrhalis]
MHSVDLSLVIAPNQKRLIGCIFLGWENKSYDGIDDGGESI